MPRTRQVALPRDRGQTPPPCPKCEWHSTMSHDHQGRPFQSLWYGADSAKQPRFSWQVYSTTTDLTDDPIDIATFLGGLRIFEYEATFDIYAPLHSTYACIEHQKMERQHRKNRNHLVEQPHAITTIPDCYGHSLELGGFIIVIDTTEWKSEGRGPLFASFDIRPASLAVVDHDLNAANAGIFEQIEMSLRRQRQPHNLGKDLFFLSVASGGDDWEEHDAEVLEKLSASPEARSVLYPSGNSLGLGEYFLVQSSQHDSGLHQVEITTETAEETATHMTYSIYTIFQIAQPSRYTLEETARSFTAAIVSHLPTPIPSVSFQFFGPLPDIGSCVSHHHSHTPHSTGYLYPGSEKRRYPEHGKGALGAAYVHVEEPEHRTFLVVLDKADWVHDEEGVLFVWDDLRPQPENLLWQINEEAMVGRLPGLKTVAERLAGLL